MQGPGCNEVIMEHFTQAVHHWREQGLGVKVAGRQVPHGGVSRLREPSSGFSGLKFLNDVGG